MKTTARPRRDTGMTPMLKQYHTIKSAHKDCILLFRLGDFYEMFYEDAKLVASQLDLVLTSRGKGTANKVPMCGFPHHAAEGYIARLVKSGHKIAICEQIEDPAQARGIVKRDVTRIITSGTYLDEGNSAARLLLSLCPNGKNVGVAFCDPASGTIQTNEIDNDPQRIAELILRQPVCECIFPGDQEEKIKKLFAHPLLKLKNIVLSPLEDWHFNPETGKSELCKHFGVHNLSGFGIEEKPFAAASSAALLAYFREMNKSGVRHVDKISVYNDRDFVFISPAAHQGLEMDKLVRTIDYTHCALGKRKLRHWFYHPLKDIRAINQRLDAVEVLINEKNLQEKLKDLFSQIPDLEKNISRIGCGYTHAKDLLAVRNTLSRLPDIRKALTPFSKRNKLFMIEDITTLRKLLTDAINEEVPLSKPEGKVIKTGFNEELDKLKNLRQEGKSWLKQYQQKESHRTGINSLKIGYNKVFGYYIEVTKTHLKKVPEEYTRKQTLVNAERFITPKLKEFEENILSAEEKILKLEADIIQKLCQEILDHTLDLHAYCDSLSTVDAILSLALLARSHGYNRPSLNEEMLIDIKEGRHPVVEKTSTERFIPNDTLLDREEGHLIILTGPNMAGKSTFIRQSAILIIMAQTGSFIPAKSATIGIVDKVFTRIGAHDDIAKGQSTFMVEMNEMADIMNNLSERSLIVLDEIGRGTSTYDGLSLAWALAEKLAATKVRTLFATHFHELTALATKESGIKNYNVAVKEWKDEIVFLHKIVPGSTDDSYGIYVAKLAGIPENIIKRSRQILTQLEMHNVGATRRLTPTTEQQMNLFTAAPDPLLEEIKEVIEAMDVNNITPVEALNELQKLKNKLNK